MLALLPGSLVPDHPDFDEMRWDRAQAALCAAAADTGRDGRRREHARRLRQEADSLISAARRSRGRSTFNDEILQLDPDHPGEICDQRGADQPDDESYVLRRSERQRATPCSWGRVAAQVDVERARPAAPLGLHVWGAKVDDTIPLRPTGRAGPAAWRSGSALLTTQPSGTHDVFSVQLEQAGRQVSAIYPIEIFANDEKGCSDNLIELTFAAK